MTNRQRQYNTDTMKSRWSSKFAFIMAATGAAVGLGNIWKFPYMAGENGGGVFVLLYLGFVGLIGIPTLMAEILIGRLGRDNPITTLENLARRSHRSLAWRYLGWWGAFGLILVLSFYSVVAGWAIGYLTKIWFSGLNGLDSPVAVETFWNEFLGSPYNLLLWHTLFMAITLGVVAAGVKEGIERAAKLLMPTLFIVLLVLLIYSTGVGNIKASISFLLTPHLSQLNATAVIYALGHAFFTLALGAGAMLVYGAYLPTETRIGSSVCIIAALDVLVALMAGLSIFSIVFGFQLSPTGGPGLMFKVLPVAFAKMPAGEWFGGLFFILLWFAAWASAISMAEPLVVLLMERMGFSRKASCVWVGTFCWGLGVMALLSFNVWQEVRILGKFTLFEAMADLTTNIILPIGGLLFAVFAGWIITPKEAREGLQLKQAFTFKIWQFLIRYIVPVGILTSFIVGVQKHVRLI